jgi:methionyl-tRNA formyltransferase
MNSSERRSNVLATSRIWAPGMEERLTRRTGSPFVLVTERKRLNVEELSSLNPQRVFLPHWSWIVQEELYTKFELVIFHMTDLPYGRGGSPLQNLLARGIYDTKITALRCSSGIDKGPIYLKRPFSLADGTAQELYTRASHVIEDMIVEITASNPPPQPQTGDPVVFKRRGPNEGDLASVSTLRQAHDYIRMLDAEGYPSAFLEVGGLKYEFSGSSLGAEGVRAQVRISEITPKGKTRE